ncbi:hypothetical protein EMIHUDRAFT_446857 [Emiliania huxleyi CCMP1516]|uniref:Uncharacterized protein n=2 Tax=Emiliania huxleyi TaxID=2903 RepID=A0A0D3KTL5_EMIH1|nr:hypothetical protein EMIHUDRAFT_446857 [Emiliania huxleyi CCMP1516]EOD39100.1 hypothetical protein EMIHUDRAFT_446857 [Emiliania huxleyi CCMP1516]|eukprot:XP_005791529.1 hypothetical protein EMIHUDRAFT_446857 [Emiliania huxleyi CCMP1516]
MLTVEAPQHAGTARTAACLSTPALLAFALCATGAGAVAWHLNAAAPAAARPGIPLCSNSCSKLLAHLSAIGVTDYTGEGTCDDGGSGSSSSACLYGTDCRDCGPRKSLEPPPPPPAPKSLPKMGTITPTSTTTIALFSGVGGKGGVTLYKGDNVGIMNEGVKAAGVKKGLHRLGEVSKQLGLELELGSPRRPRPILAQDSVSLKAMINGFSDGRERGALTRTPKGTGRAGDARRWACRRRRRPASRPCSSRAWATSGARRERGVCAQGVSETPPLLHFFARPLLRRRRQQPRAIREQAQCRWGDSRWGDSRCGARGRPRVFGRGGGPWRVRCGRERDLERGVCASATLMALILP